MARTQQIGSRIFGMADAAASDWFKRQSRNLHAVMYFWYKPGEIAFWIGEEPLSDQWELAHPDRIGAGMTRIEVCAHLQHIARRLPILG